MFKGQSKKLFFSLDPAPNNDGFASLQQEAKEQLSEGQLAVDVAQTDAELVIVAAMAGTKPEHIQLHLHNDLLTIRGQRLSPIMAAAEHYNQECYWGKFSRSIILPVDVRAELAQAQYTNGVLTLRIPKAKMGSTIPIMVIED